MSLTVFDILELNGGAPPAELVTEIKGNPECQRVLFGYKKEDNNVGVLCTQWSSAEAAQTFSSSDRPGVQESRAFELLSSAGLTLSAPCTEVFTAFDAQAEFAGNLARFVGKLDGSPPEGYHGGGIVRGVEGGVKGEVFRLLLGWESVEAHVLAKGVSGGVIQENIHELREKRGSVDLFHVEFKEL